VLRRSLPLFAIVLVALVAIATPAWAHVEIEPAEAIAGSTETLTFSVAYEGAATIGLEVQIPDGATVVSVPDKPGWQSDVDEAARTVSWTGGSVAADDTFAVEVELPPTPGVVLFPAIQLTTEGEVAWIGEEEDEGHGTNPAPRLTLIADPNPTTTTTTTAATTTTTVVSTTTTDRPSTTVEVANEGDGDDAAPWLLGAGIAAVVAIALGGWFLKRRADADAAPPTDAASPDDTADTAPPEDGPGGSPE
jgi:uncharacterized protein YcnI